MMNEAILRTTNEAGAQETYLLGSSNEETTRLMHQGNAYRPLTRRVFTEAGITRGMRVLDLGSGAGDVAFLTSDLVGDEGSVVGIDRDPKVLAVARKRAQAQHSPMFRLSKATSEGRSRSPVRSMRWLVATSSCISVMRRR